MTGEGVFFAAHEGDALSGDAAADAVEAFLEKRERGDAVVAGLGADVAFALGAAGTQFVAHEDVMDVAGAEGGVEGFAVELRSVLAVGLGADVGDAGDLVLGEEVEKAGDLVIRVADGEERIVGGSGHFLHSEDGGGDFVMIPIKRRG